MSFDTANLFTEYTGQTSAKCVVAIDFGTWGTGFAYAFPPSSGNINARTDIYTKGQWEDGATGKTKTILLLGDNDDFIAFGGQAENRYRALAQKGRGKYFQFFKMQLYTQKITGNFRIKAENGKSAPAVLVFTRCLEYLRDILLKQIQMENNEVSLSDIKWILTVPAIWNDAAKQIMSDAARVSGFGKRFQLALEPEAASLWCLRSSELRIKHGDQYVVVDCGGGTIDVTVHEKIDGKAGDSIKEIFPANGGGWGSTSINDRTFKMLKDIFGTACFTRMTNDALGYFNLKREVEAAKIAFDIEADVVLTLPETLTSHQHGEASAEDAIKAYKQSHNNIDLFFRRPNFTIPAEYFCEEIIGPTIKSTYAHVKNVLNNNSGVSWVILVGNFANCRVLQDKFQEFKTDSRKVAISPFPGDAIMKGAVIFGANPGLVTERISRFTYGIGVHNDFIEGKHLQEKKYISKSGNVDCKDVFDAFITENEELPLGHLIKRTYCPVEHDQKNIRFSIYSTPKRNVEYIDEFRVKKIGSFSIDISSGHEEVKVFIHVTTEILMKAINESGKEEKLELKFNE